MITCAICGQVIDAQSDKDIEVICADCSWSIEQEKAVEGLRIE